MGKSRSATCMIAYLMHRDPTLTPSAALSSLREARPICEPNDGFTQQLELYHQMRCPANVDIEPAYQRWLYKREVEMSVACGMAPDHIRFQDEQDGGGTEGPTRDLELRCRKCRRTLAASQHLVPHTPKPPVSSSTSSSSGQQPHSPRHPQPQPQPRPPCAHLYIDPLSWMRPELEQGKLDGRLECPKCGTNVGKYAWQGMRCSCGGWVVPAVCLARGRVDEVKSRPGVRATGMGPGPGRDGGNL